ncbi:flagellar export chaperone FliS [Zestomonas carbonaria]|uniref:Flagellar secretion chaperone FliS n=1 Tax=Zestomonas carbonaria TaxID=2762745 RepID=A0A7U7EQD4_9GAMM|nr:flagellar export chaperone FliS [Pseudomonas carbonaria]CAD5109263.1 Flagellar secretion chaperone FliS [Pseudomonas carbonaria]
MNASTALRQYQAVNTNVMVAEASPHRLVQMLMDGQLSRMAQARGALERGQLASKGELISRAIAIVGGLRGALDMERGGEVAVNLDRLYEYMTRRLVEANATNDLAILDEISQLMRTIKSGWDAIAPLE